jgi:hypothetical protein
MTACFVTFVKFNETQFQSKFKFSKVVNLKIDIFQIEIIKTPFRVKSQNSTNANISAFNKYSTDIHTHIFIGSNIKKILLINSSQFAIAI